jgi:hypothetical protein
MVVAKCSNLNEIVTVATVVREVLEEFYDAGRLFYTTNKNLEGACNIGSLVLSSLIGYPEGFTVGEFSFKDDTQSANCSIGHCWVTLKDNLIIDITATQFHSKLPKVCISYSENYVKESGGINIFREFWNDLEQDLEHVYEASFHRLGL